MQALNRPTYLRRPRSWIAHAKEWTVAYREAAPRTRYLMTAALATAIVVAMAVAVALPMTTTASYENLLKNGGFEHGFSNQNSCGTVGAQWQCFTNGGAANYGFYDDQWEKVVANGKHSQLIEINTKNIMAGDADRYAGISQTVRVVDRAKYKFSMKGMIRTTNTEGDPWRYRVQFGWTRGPHADWQKVENWVDAPWDTYYDRTAPGGFSHFETMLMPGADVITVYVRVWKKWGVPDEELDVNLDNIALVGPPARAAHPGTGGPVQQKGQMGKPAPHADAPQQHPPKQPMPSGELVCQGDNLIYNGSFERGFRPVKQGEAGKSWRAFTNGGAANYGFYDDQWAKVVADGEHSQLIEINSKVVYPTDANRYAGIYQLVGGLQPGKIYELSLRGTLRGEGNEDDAYRFEAQWGYNEGPDSDWRNVDNWEGMDLGPIYARTAPGAMGSYSVRFKAPSHQVMIFLRGWKKWAVTDVEMDLNYDAISLRACHPQQQSKPPMQKPSARPESKPSKPQPKQHACVYHVQRGDSLSRIALEHGVSMQALGQANGIKNPNILYAGQKLVIPGCGVGGPVQGQKAPQASQPAKPKAAEMRPGSQGMQKPAANQPMRPDGMSGKPQVRTHRVMPRESLSVIAAKYGVPMQALGQANGITNPNIIYVGQVLRIP